VAVTNTPDPTTPDRTLPRRVAVAHLHRIASAHARGYRQGLTRAQALAELATVSTDPDLLAEAAAQHALADDWFAILAVELLMEAGAERTRIEHHVDQRGPGWIRR
jgi:hypothetical protein